MLYSSIIVAASAFAGLASAQNSTGSYNTPIPCCSVDPGSVPQDDKQAWCNANQNTCVSACGGQSSVASQGNNCNSQTLEFDCKCRNETDITSALGNYEQSVEGQMCRYWYDQCVTASGSDAAARFECEQARDAECGTEKFDAAATSSGAASSGSPSATNSGSSPDNTGDAAASGASSTPTEGAAVRNAMYGAPALAGGLFALFGFAL
ncbi:uncharacterized protein J4E78_004278 [Alternaria triticimaculans]|uniref:uncharacterized protein n=1 Tax=Alternaria triticimaculans TaxID=297637 RepID=UPI0020C4FBD2|nr:uncharacterized protein J4E78_004278 [Alternaria triticimaculans]KAI4663859.1 hypothetical protein J4E78_004278 [Alternaria triticimaculans]